MVSFFKWIKSSLRALEETVTAVFDEPGKALKVLRSEMDIDELAGIRDQA